MHLSIYETIKRKIEEKIDRRILFFFAGERMRIDKSFFFIGSYFNWHAEKFVYYWPMLKTCYNDILAIFVKRTDFCLVSRFRVFERLLKDWMD